MTDQVADANAEAIFTKEQLLAFATTSPRALFENGALFKTLPFAQELFEAAAKKDPHSAFFCANHYDDAPFVSDVLGIAAKKDTKTAFEFTGWWMSKNIPAEAMEDILLTALDGGHHHKEAFTNALKYIDEPYAEKVLLKAVTKLTSEEDIKAVFAQQKDYYAHDYIGRVLDAVCQLPADEKRDDFIAQYAFLFAEKFANQPYAGDVLKAAATKDPSYAFTEFKGYENQLYAKDVLMIGAEQGNANAFYPTGSGYLSAPFAADILRVAAEKNPHDALNHCSSFVRHRNIDVDAVDEILTKAVEASPATMFSPRLLSRQVLNKQLIADDLYVLAAQEDGQAAFDGVDCFKDLGFASEVMRAAAKQNPQAALAYVEKGKGQAPFSRLVKMLAENELGSQERLR